MESAGKQPPTVAVLGARFGDLKIEERLLRPLRVRLVEGSGQDEGETARLCAGAEVILCGGAPKISASTIRQLPELKGIVRYGIGVDTVDLNEATRRGVFVANVPDYCIDEVASHALALILSWTRKLPTAHQSTQSGRWDVGVLKPMQSFRDLTLGIVGFGKIARTLARMARPLGFQVCASDPYVESKELFKKKVQPRTLKQLLKVSDLISLHLPLDAKTHHLIDEKNLRLMKPTAYLINTSRGGLIDEIALYQAVKEGWIAGAALDVLEKEPWRSDSPLRSLENIMVTPHSAWYTERSQKELRRKACAEVIRILRGKIPTNLVNRELLR